MEIVIAIVQVFLSLQEEQFLSANRISVLDEHMYFYWNKKEKKKTKIK